MTERTMMKIARRALLGLALLPFVSIAGPTITQIEDAVETDAVDLRLDAAGNGFAVVRSCARCDPIRLAVTPATTAWENGVAVPVRQAMAAKGSNIVVFFAIDAKTVTRIVW